MEPGELEKILEVKNLKVHFRTDEGTVKAVDGISFDVHKRQTLGIVGESGCGKSVSSLAVLRLLPEVNSAVEGEIIYKGRNLLELSPKEMRKVRGKEIAMIFQDPQSSLNPVFTIGNQIMETILLHQKVKRKEARDIAIEMLRKVKLPDPEKRIGEYPCQLSGGMQQRAMIAMALSCNPGLLIADEPTTALDVTVQAQILNLMNELKETIDTSIILITHDLGVVAEVTDNVAVMYAGKIVEYGPKRDIFKAPMHPYTVGLMESIPKRGQSELKPIKGVVPSLIGLPPGCTFAPRCEFRDETCGKEMPELKGEGHKVRCWLYDE